MKENPTHTHTHTQLKMVFFTLALFLALSIAGILVGMSDPFGVRKTATNLTSPRPLPSSASPVDKNSPAHELALSPDLRKTDGYRFLDLIPVGRKAPDFSTRAADGKQVRLSAFRGKKNVVLVFYQGNFCSVCGAQLTDLQKHLSDFRKQDAEIITISADNSGNALKTMGEHGLSFTVAADPGKKIIRRFGVGNVAKKGIAWPSVYIVDKAGVIRLSYASADGHRLHSSEILPKLSRITGRTSPTLKYED